MRQLAGFSKGAMAWRLAWTSAVLAAPWLVPNAYFRYLLPLLVVAPIVALELLRGLTVWRVKHEVTLDDAGLTFAWGKASFLLPYLLREERRVSWADLRGVRTSEVRVNGVPTTTLVVETAGGSFEVSDAFLTASAHQLQRAVLDHLATPSRPADTSDFARLCAVLHRQPLWLHAPAGDIVTISAMGVFVAGFPAWMAVDSESMFMAGFAVIAGLLFGSIIFMVVKGWLQQRVLVLTADGFTLGSASTPWARVRALRKTVTNGRTSSFEVLLHEGPAVSVSAKFALSLDRLAALMNPEGAEFQQARAALAGGATPEDAIRAAGLEALTRRPRAQG